MADHALDRIGDGERDLVAQPLRQGPLRRHERFEIIFATVAGSGSSSGPFRIACRHIGKARTQRRGLVERCVFERLLARVVVGRTVGRTLPSRRFCVRGRTIGSYTVGSAARRWLVFRATLKQRIALELGFDIGRKVKIRQLKQLDGLHQLRRHHQRLALPDLESLGQRHTGLRGLVRFLLLRITSLIGHSPAVLLRKL